MSLCFSEFSLIMFCVHSCVFRVGGESWLGPAEAIFYGDIHIFTGPNDTSSFTITYFCRRGLRNTLGSLHEQYDLGKRCCLRSNSRQLR